MKYCKIPTYKYRLLEDDTTKLSEVFWQYSIKTDFIAMSSGYLILKEGYAWDGASGPAIDTKNFMRGSLVHDALCQLIWLGALPESRQKDADKELRRICREDGMTSLRAWWVYAAVRGYSYIKKNPAEPRVFEV